MKFLRKRWMAIAAVLLLVGVPSAWSMARPSASADNALVAKVKKGDFKVMVSTSGELRAREFVQITAPPEAQQAGAYQMKIQSIVPEGTVVKKGDVVAELDRSTLASKLQETSLALQKAEAVYEQATLDSALNLSKARDDIHNMELGLEEKKLAKEEAVYEAPTIKRQADIDYEKADRALAQAKTDYVTKTEQAKAKMREVGADRDRQRNQLNVVQHVLEGFTIKAPSPGMVIYVKEWNGRKRTTGSQVTSWDPAVATLPDLSQMESITYVNEIDIRKVAAGQPVSITLDADPTKKLTGKVSSVANVGEQRPNQDAKVFEVHVPIDQPDTTLRPGMTTANSIETLAIKDVMSVPLDALNSENGIPFVYKKDGSSTVKQEVVTGALNDDEVVIQRGLEADERVMLTPPADHDKMKIDRLPDSPANVPSKALGGDTATGKQAVPVTPPPKGTPALPAKPPATKQ